MDYSAYKSLQIMVQDGIATLTLNRPEQLNAFNDEMIGEVERIWDDLARDEAVNVIVVTGAGRAFSAGGDIKRMAARATGDVGAKVSKALRSPSRSRRLLASILEVEQPIIAAINGDAMGLGQTIGLMCDMTVMAEAARMGDTHVKVGLVAGDGGALILPALIGIAKAKEMLMCARIVNGAEAARMGLVNYAVPTEQVLPKAMELARELNALPRWAVRWTKLAVNKELKQRLNLVIDASMAYEMLSLQTHDHGEAALAFAEKRRPQFTGE